MFTIGHSTRSLEDFIELLRLHGVSQVLDVRTIPRSRHNPQFNSDSLASALAKAGIGYHHLAGLGGLRRPCLPSTNAAWRNASFRGFADYMQTPEFAKALKELIGLVRSGRPALMCAEAVPWRCHRSLIADALLAHHITVAHIISRTSCRAHVLTPFAKIEGSHVVYPLAEEAASTSEQRCCGFA